MIHLAMILVTQMVMMAATSNGKMQYPSRHIDWKKPMFPPRRTTLHVSTTAPADREANTSCKQKYEHWHMVYIGHDNCSLHFHSHVSSIRSAQAAGQVSYLEFEMELTEKTLPGFWEPADKQIASVRVKTCEQE